MFIDVTFQCFEDFLLEGAGGSRKMVIDFLSWITLNFTNAPLYTTHPYIFPKKLSVNHSLKKVKPLDLGPPYLAPR